MADRMYLSEDSFRGRRRRGRPPAQSQQATTNWRQKWAQMNQISQPILSQEPYYRISNQPVQPKFHQSQYPAQMKSQPVDIEVIDLTEDVNDENSEANPKYESLQNLYQRPSRFKSGPFHDNQVPEIPPAPDASFQHPVDSNPNRTYASQHHEQIRVDQKLRVEQGGYEKVWHETQDFKYNTNDYSQTSEQQKEVPERLSPQQRPYEPRHQGQTLAHPNGYCEYFPTKTSDYAAAEHFEPCSAQPPQVHSQRVQHLTADALPQQTHGISHSANRNAQHVKQWLKSSVPPPSTPYHIDDQRRASQFNYHNQEDDVVVNVPASRGSSTLDDHANDHDQLLENSEGNNSYSTLNTSFAAPPILDQRAHQLKVAQKERFARIRLQNTQSSKICSQSTPSEPTASSLNSQHDSQSTHGSNVRQREEYEDGLSDAAPAKRRKVSRTKQAESAFDPFEPPPSMQRTVRFQDSYFKEGARAGIVMDLTSMATNQATRISKNLNSRPSNPNAEYFHLNSAPSSQSTLWITPEIPSLIDRQLQRAQKGDEDRIAAKLARDREKLLEQDEDLQKARREERQALLRIGLHEAKAARIEEHQKRMAVLEERQRAIDEKAAQHRSEEEKRQAAEAEKERVAKKEREAANREAALQRTIQARKEGELFKAQKTAAIAAFRQELKGPLPSRQPGDGMHVYNPTAFLKGALPPQKISGNGSTASARTAPTTPSDRRKEVEEAKARAEAKKPLGLRQKDLEDLAKREKAVKQAEAQRQKEEKRKKKEEARKAKELHREARRKEKEAAKEADQESRPRKRPVKLPKPAIVVQPTIQQPAEAPKKTVGGFLEDDSDASSDSSLDSESDEDALFCSASKETASVSNKYTAGLPRCDYHRKQYGKCPVDCKLKNFQAGPVSSTSPPEPRTALSTPFSGFTTSSVKATNHVSHASRPKPKQLHSSPTTSQVSNAATGGRTGGKTMNLEAIAAYFESIRELREDEEEEDADVDSDAEELVHEREKREYSPITEKDVYHWSYQVMRKTWYMWMAEDAAEWIICGKAGYSSLQQANAMADKEATRQRHGYSLQPSNAEWSRKMDKHGMVQIYMDCTSNVKKPGFVRIKVDRRLRTLKNGIRPETKFGWLKTTVWEIRKTTVTTTIIPTPAEEEIDDLFEEQEPKPEPQTETTEEIEVIDNCIFTNVDEANRKAAGFALDIVAPKPRSGRIDDNLEYIKKKQEESNALFALCDELEQDGDDGTFEADLPSEGGSMIKIEVVARELKGPRNI